MATIDRLKSGRYRARIRLTGFPAESRTFSTLAEAKTWAALRERDLAKLVCEFAPARPSMTLREALVRYKHEVSAHKRGWRQEFIRIETWLQHPLADRRLKDIRGADLSQHRSVRLALGKAPNTVRLELALISHTYEVARADWGLEFLSNPRKAMRRTRLGGARDRRLRAGEFDALMAWCNSKDNKRLQLAVILAIETAMRRGELMSLLWENVSFHDRIAYLPTTKNSTARTVPLSTRAIAALEAFGPRKNGSVLARSDSWITKAFIDARQACGIADLRFHDLRHEAVSRLFEKGFNMMEAATVSGHKTLQMLKRYTHLDPRKLVDRLG